MQYISKLFYKLFTGKITDDELPALHKWANGSRQRKMIYELLSNPDELQREYRHRKLVDTIRAEDEMKRMIAKAEAGKRRKIRYTVAAAAAVLAGIIILTSRTESAPDLKVPEVIAEQNSDDTEIILPGKTKALIHSSNGKAIALNAADTATCNRFFLTNISEAKTIEPENLCVEVPRGGEFKIILEDSTVVWLNSESTLRYPETFGSAERRVEITGEAYFKVHHEPERPFYVVSGNQQIRVYGTSFNVRDYSDDDTSYTTLETGSIALSRLDRQGGEVFLSPGHQAVFNKDESQLSMKVVRTDVITGWRHGRFVFEGQTLRNIMRDLARWYDFEYEFNDPNIAEIRFHGSIPRYSEFITAITILENCGGVKFNISGNHVDISRQP